MNKNCYSDILRCILFHTKPSKETLCSLSLLDLYEFCELNKLLTCCVELTAYWPIETDKDKELITYWKNKAAGNVFMEYQKLTLVKSLQELAVEKHIPLIFFKGYSLACLYPNFTMRNSSDTDIYVPSSYKEEALSILHALSYVQIEELNTEHTLTFLYEKDRILIHKIELHFSLYEDLSPSQIALLDKIRLFSPDLSVNLSLGVFTIQTPDYQQHLIYQFIHMIKHFCEQGFPARYLLDTVLFIRRYETLMDFTYVEKIMDEMGYLTFYVNFLTILIKEFDVPSRILPKDYSCKIINPDDFLSDIYGFGMRSKGAKEAHYFFCFYKYLEKNPLPLHTPVTYDGTSVPFSVVPSKYQCAGSLQKRIGLLWELDLI